MSLNDVVLNIVIEKGPMLPAEIVSEVSKRTGKQTDMFFIGAVLSELMSSKQVMMSYAKLGGSRLYYSKGQENNLSRLYDYLNDKEKKAYDLLKKEKILRNSEQEPVIRVALSELKDFSKYLDVNINSTERFWYWHMISVDEAKSLIKESLKNEIEGLKKEKENSKSNVQDPEKFIDKNIVASSSKSSNDFFIGSQNFNMKKDTKNGENQINNLTPKSELNSNNGRNENFITKNSNQNTQTQSVRENSQERSDKEIKNEENQKEIQAREQQSTLKSLDTEDDFMRELVDYFNSSEIKIIEGYVLRKNSDCEFQVYVKSQIGKLRYYIYAKSKKKISETDIGYAYVRSQNKNLPLCFVSNGDLTKKASEFLETEVKNVNFLKM